jgi:hypothetical protein
MSVTLAAVMARPSHRVEHIGVLALRLVLANRQLTPSQDDDARTDLATLGTRQPPALLLPRRIASKVGPSTVTPAPLLLGPPDAPGAVPGPRWQPRRRALRSPRCFFGLLMLYFF